MSYKEFTEFHNKHPDLDNQEYYAEFPDSNKSTIRSWKNRIRKPLADIPEPTEEEAEKATGYEEEYLKLLCTQTGTPYSDFEGVDVKSAILILKNKLKDVQLNESVKKTNRGSNTSILPIPKPIGQNLKKYGIDEYIAFDLDKNEINMEIPWTVLFDPEKNEALGKEIE